MASVGYKVVSTTPVVVTDGSTNISYFPGAVFFEDPQNLSVQRLLAGGQIIVFAGLEPPAPTEGFILTPGPPGPPGPAGASGASNVGLAATLYVDPDTGNDGTAVRGSISLKYLTIQAAITAAVVGDTIRVANGTYTQDLTVKSNISVIGESRRGVIVAGNVTWTPIGSIDEFPVFKALTVPEPHTVSMDATGKTGGTAYFYFDDVSAGTATSVGRPSNNEDGFYLFNIDLPEDDGTRWTVDATDGVFIADVSQIAGVTAHGDCLVSMHRSIVFTTLTHTGTGAPSLLYCQLVGNVLLENPTGSGPFAEARRSIFYGNVNVNQAASWDAYDCTFLGLVMNQGLGTVNRNDGPFQGGNPGRTGLVPQPSSSDAARFLSGSGSWQDIDQPTSSTATTSDDTPNTMYTKTLVDSTVYVFEATVAARNSAHRGSFRRRALIYREGGGATRSTLASNEAGQVVGTDDETDAGLAVEFVVSGNDVMLQVTGLAATTIDWQAKITFQQTFSGPQ